MSLQRTPAVPSLELRLRLAAAVLLAIVVMWGAALFGPVVSGVLLSMPITGSVMPPFTLALYGADAVAPPGAWLIVGLCGFSTFFFTVAAAIVPLGIAAGLLAAGHWGAHRKHDRFASAQGRSHRGCGRELDPQRGSIDDGVGVDAGVKRPECAKSIVAEA